jgi:hypothetical protein
VLSWKFCNNGKGRLNSVYMSDNKISFSNKIEGNRILAMKVEKKHRLD